jgi:hypothetical protein
LLRSPDCENYEYCLLCREVLLLEHAIRRVKSMETFTGWNYFRVTRPTLTAMVSTTVTYLIVLLQSQNT